MILGYNTDLFVDMSSSFVLYFFPVEAKRPGHYSPNNVVFRHYRAIMDKFVTK